MNMRILSPVLQGAGVAVFLSTIGVSEFSQGWWVALIALNIAISSARS